MKRSDNPVQLVRVQYTGGTHYSILLDYEDVDGLLMAVDALKLVGGLAAIVGQLISGNDPVGNYTARTSITTGHLLLDEREV